MKTTPLFLAAALALSAPLPAATYHVSDKAGDDTLDGLDEKTAWKTLAHACEKVAAGDTVTVHPGVYFEPVRLEKTGTAAEPIRFTADAVEKNRVILTGARRDIRQGDVIWKTDDAKLGIHSLKVDARPARVLVGETDLFSYPSLAELQALTFATGAPGPARGFFYDETEHRLHVRLSAQDGPANPARHVIKVAPAGSSTRSALKPADYNFGVVSTQPAGVVLEGFTFETPGLCGVFAAGGGVTVRDCWFLGCRTGVAGRPVAEGKGADDVTVERCDFTQAPAFADAEEMLARAGRLPEKERAKLPPFFWNIRSGGPATYDYGLVLHAGARWKILRNYIHDAIDGLTLGEAREPEVAGNTFERLLSSAIETGNHCASLRAHHNFIADVTNAFSWNPKSGTPWPGPLTFDHNTVTSTGRGAKFWLAAGTPPDAFELHCADENWTAAAMKDVPPLAVKIPGAGLAAFNNTVILPTGDVFSFTGLRYRKIEGLRLLNNLVVTRGFTPERYHGAADLSGMEFDGNLVAAGSPEGSGPGSRFAGPHGKTFADAAALGLADPTRRDFTLKPKSPALAAGADVRDLAGISTDAGAFARGADGHHALAGPKISSPAKPAAPPGSPAPVKPQ